MALIEAKIEGPIEKIEALGPGVQITAMGVKIAYSPGPVLAVPPPPAGTPTRKKSIKSPSQRLTVADLLKVGAFPARNYGPDPIKGFTGGTVIAEGFFNTDVMPNRFEANHLFVEPAENVMIGALTGNTIPSGSSSGVITVNGVEAVILTDGRLSTNPAMPTTPVYLNEFGFEILPHNGSITPSPIVAPAVPLPAPTAVEGYFGNDGKIYAHLFEYGGPGLLANPMLPLISIERADVRDEGTEFSIEVRGHVTTPHTPVNGPRQTIELFILDMVPGTEGIKDDEWVRRSNSPLVGNTRLDFRDPGVAPFNVVPPVQRWRFRGTLPKSGINLLPPERIEARNATAELAVHVPIKTVLDTDVRE